MRLDQPKIDLAVLLKLFQHADNDGGAESVDGIRNLFQIDISTGRILAALEGLEGRGEVSKEHDRYAVDETVWRINRDGIRTVENALRAPNSFIARLNGQGDAWLTGDEAGKAKLNKIKRSNTSDPAVLFYDDPRHHPPSSQSAPVLITNNFTPSNVANSEVHHSDQKTDSSGWWNLGAAIIIGIVTITITLWIAGKI